eukprot:scaffold12388_cov122-Isochrysis_galbana.AAC.7
MHWRARKEGEGYSARPISIRGCSGGWRRACMTRGQAPRRTLQVCRSWRCFRCSEAVAMDCTASVTARGRAPMPPCSSSREQAHHQRLTVGARVDAGPPLHRRLPPRGNVVFEEPGAQVTAERRRLDHFQRGAVGLREGRQLAGLHAAYRKGIDGSGRQPHRHNLLSPGR